MAEEHRGRWFSTTTEKLFSFVFRELEMAVQLHKRRTELLGGPHDRVRTEGFGQSSDTRVGARRDSRVLWSDGGACAKGWRSRRWKCWRARGRRVFRTLVL